MINFLLLFLRIIGFAGIITAVYALIILILCAIFGERKTSDEDKDFHE